MPVSRSRMGLIIVFAVVGALISGSRLYQQLKSPNKPPAQNGVVPQRPTPLHVEGDSLHAVFRAYAALVADDQIPRKEIANYSVDIIQEPQYYKIKFKPAPLPADKSLGGIQREIHYWISRGTGRLTRSQ